MVGTDERAAAMRAGAALALRTAADDALRERMRRGLDEALVPDEEATHEALRRAAEALRSPR